MSDNETIENVPTGASSGSSGSSGAPEDEREDIVYPEEIPKRKFIIRKVQNLSEVDQSWSIEKIVKERPPLGWGQLFKDYEAGARHVDKVLKNFGDDFVPHRKDLFNAFHWTPCNKVKIIIVGQDPYHTVKGDVPQAVGASFSLRRDASLQPSLQNIYKELKIEYGDDFNPPKHGDLQGWARQGVLLLNTCLTTEPGIPKAHTKKGATGNMWTGLISQTFKMIRETRPHTVVMLWGKDAQNQVSPFIGRLHVLEAAHPSPFSARQFFGCNHFILANEYLVSKGETPVDWNRFD